MESPGAKKDEENADRSDSRYRAASRLAAMFLNDLTQGGARRLACPGLLPVALIRAFSLRLRRQLEIWIIGTLGRRLTAIREFDSILGSPKISGDESRTA
jgi:hypothetical protein